MRLTHVEAGDAFVRLRRLNESDRAPLAALAADPALWRHWPRDVLGAGWDAVFDWQLDLDRSGAWLIHVVETAAGPVGQTCYMALAPEHARVEIGGTWYAAAAQGTAVNPAAKRLMLGHAFACGAERVELKTDADNLRSRRAMEKMGATFEGVHRRHMRRPHGGWRDTAWYSVLAEEWPAVRAGLETRLAAYAAASA